MRHMVGALSRHQFVLIGFVTGALDVVVGLLAGLSFADVSLAIANARVSMKARRVLSESGKCMHIDMKAAADMFS